MFASNTLENESPLQTSKSADVAIFVSHNSYKKDSCYGFIFKGMNGLYSLSCVNKLFLVFFPSWTGLIGF